ncbi:hypothetical protein [Rhodovulum adriaticum]|uniref:50S ribosomal protein L35 n=1 Tax=Rhodovulum adriaticum TaxID=35804 RepID=A0A4R2NKG8_RHOAD|nr:hypothetical protein [Rhodovulum adriaticum]MBK1635538.1 hypothetical protein [Rhodovulum adriaticum]TCP21828.1 hypothetical protein EV656_10980 [Rhodovulum adriaticum]
MESDLFLVAGVIAGVLAVPAFLSAYTDGRSPVAAGVMALIAGAAIAYAVISNPVGYQIEDVPEVFVRVIGRFLN